MSVLESKIEKSILRVTNWHRQSCRLITNDDREGQVFLSLPQTNNEFLFLHTFKYGNFIIKNGAEDPEHAGILHKI